MQRIERLGRIAAIALLAGSMADLWINETSGPTDPPAEEFRAASAALAGHDLTDRETTVSGYVGAPFYYRSDVRMSRNDDTDVVLKRLGWDGDALYFPIDGGVRSVSWNGSFGFMIDFLHNKAIARLGRGAHGRRLANPIVEEVEATGRLKGAPAPARLKLTDVFERLEFTHGHNVLLLNGMMRL
ncbi:MAG TPA: lipid A oxidase, partial [Hyphomicrobiaceae bacterium]|nr:lipid A oxidase [Hyphomicrobiaceae bacterium]